ncbi:MAG TPA: hypothetical protein VGE39_17695 [Prosthecobacter sp.]
MTPGRTRFLRLFSSAVLSQALVSAASLLVGLVLIRQTSDLEYGYYVLVFNALLLLASLQNAFIGPPMVVRLTALDAAGRGDLVGGLHRGQRRLMSWAGPAAALLVALLWFAGLLDHRTGPLLLAAIATAWAVLNREYFRMVLMAAHRPAAVLRADLPYGALLVAGAVLATRTALPAAAAVLALGVAAAAGGLLMYRALRQAEPWNPQGAPGILRQIAPLGLWSAGGAAVHWTFTQGYSYLAAGTLDVTAVAALAATRLLMMPLNLVSSGIGALMLPMASRWLRDHGAATVLRRLGLFALAMGGVALCYFGVMWLLRDWIFDHLLRKDFPQRDRLLLLWSGIFLLMVMRDQLIYLLLACERFRTLTMLSLASALVSLSASWWGMQQHGTAGALIGMLLGEALNIAGILLWSLRESGWRPRRGSLPEAQQL